MFGKMSGYVVLKLSVNVLTIIPLKTKLTNQPNKERNKQTNKTQLDNQPASQPSGQTAREIHCQPNSQTAKFPAK
jgi:hypothetical protein